MGGGAAGGVFAPKLNRRIAVKSERFARDVLHFWLFGRVFFHAFSGKNEHFVRDVLHFPAFSAGAAILGVSWVIFGPSWGILGPSWDILGSSRAIFGPSWHHLGGILGHLGVILAFWGSSWAISVLSSALLGLLWGSWVLS